MAIKKTRNVIDPFPNYPEWSNSKFWSYIRSALRSSSSRYPVKYAVKNAARRVSQSTNKKVKWEYKCAVCGEWFQGKDVQVDHIKGHLILRNYSDLPKFVEDLFCSADHLQVLCKPDHEIKTKLEREERKNVNEASMGIDSES